MRIFSAKRMMALNRKLCDIDTRRGMFLTPAGCVVRMICKAMETMRFFGFTGKELNHMGQSLRAMERKKKALVVTEESEQYKDWPRASFRK